METKERRGRKSRLELPTIQEGEPCSFEGYDALSLMSETAKLGGFEYFLNEALKKKHNYVVCELDYGDPHTTDPIRTWLQRFSLPLF